MVVGVSSASIKKGLSKLKTEAETRSLYYSGLGRSRADWLMGMNVTMALTTAFGAGGKGGVLHCGRVQTPVLGLIVRRERAINQFVPKTHYVLDAKFEIQGSIIPMDLIMAAEHLDAQGHCVNQALMQTIAAKINRKIGRVSDVKSTPERELPPLPYYLGSLQKEASKRFGLKVQVVLDACQSLSKTQSDKFIHGQIANTCQRICLLKCQPSCRLWWPSIRV